MMSLRDVMTVPYSPVCHAPESPRREAAAIGRVVITDADWRLSGLRAGMPYLAVVPAEGMSLDARSAGEAMRRLAQQGVTVLALAAPVGAWPEGVCAVARGLGLPLLAPAEGGETAEQIRVHLLDLQVGIRDAQEAQLDQAAALARQMESDPAGAGERLTSWLAAELAGEDSTVTLVPPRAGAPAVLEGDAAAIREYERVRDGSRPSGQIAESQHVVLYPVGPVTPAEVLVGTSRREWTPHAIDLVREIAGHISTARRGVTWQSLRSLELAVRVTILQQLLTGAVAEARRHAAQLPSGGHLPGTDARMAILECAQPEEREQAVLAAEQATGRGALVAKCPAMDRHVLLLIPQQVARTDDDVQEMLSPLVDEPQGAAVGVSGALPYHATALNYTVARRALATARTAPQHIAVRAGGPTLATELPPDLYAAWGHAVRAPLAAIPTAGRETMLHTVGMALAYGVKEAGALMSCDKATVSRWQATVLSTMGLDPAQHTHRAVAQLALLAPADEPDPSTPVRPLRDLLRHEGPRRWAQEILRPIRDQPESMRLLTTWLRCGAHQNAAAEELGISKNTIPRRLRALSGALSLALLDPGGGFFEPLWALTILGELDDVHLPDPVLQTALH
jgi:hypothetical protein